MGDNGLKYVKSCLGSSALALFSREASLGLGGCGGGGEGERVEKQSLKATGYVKEGHRAAH